MMAKLVMLRGLPGSGKSTWAKARVLASQMSCDDPDQWEVRVNKDDIRLSLGMDRKAYKREQETAVIDRRDHLISQALKEGRTVYSDDTNFGRKHEPRLRYLATLHKAAFEIKDFTNVPVETCIARDALRSPDTQVGADVIWGMAEQNLGVLRPKDVVTVTDPTLPKVIICDLDGTLALHEGLRGPYEHEKAADDRCNMPVKALLCLYTANGYALVYLSGRETRYRPQTVAFLSKHQCPDAPLFMRSTGDTRNDTIVKRELFDAHIRGKYNVEFCLDDRDRIVKLWRDMGLACWQVNYGNF